MFHLAAVLDDGVLLRQTWTRFSRVLAPKVAGAWNLHEATASLELDHFVMFSSLASVIGNQGQGNYAAANAFLDALGHRRTAEGRPGTAINWGQWAGIGLAAGAAMESRQDDFADWGFLPVPLGPGIAAAESWLTSGVAQIVIAPVHWPTFFARFPHGAEPLLFAELAPSSTPTNLAPHPPDEAPILDRLRRASADDRTALMQAYLQRQFATVLRTTPDHVAVDRNIEDLELDSRMVVEVVGHVTHDLALPIYPEEFWRSPMGSSSWQRTRRPRCVDDGASTTGRVEPVRRDEPGRLRAVLWDNARRPATNRSAERLPSVVFVLSSPRSGSTLLRVMLAGHSRLFAPPELHLLQFESMAERRNGLQGSYLEEGLQRAVMAIAGDTADQAKARLDEWCREDIRIEEVYRWLQAHAGARRLVDKSPAYGGSANTLRRAETMFEGARYVHLVRHPSAMIESFVRMRMNQLLGTGAANPTEVAEEMWASSNDNIRQFLAEVDPLRHRLVHYEIWCAVPNKR